MDLYKTIASRFKQVVISNSACTSRPVVAKTDAIIPLSSGWRYTPAGRRPTCAKSNASSRGPATSYVLAALEK